MNTYCQIDKDGVCKAVYHTNDDAFEPPTDYAITSGADRSWIGTKQWNGNAWNDYEPPKRILSKYEFIQRLQPEFVDILTAAKTDVQVEAYYQMAMAATEINLDDPNTSPGLDLLVAKGLLTVERKAEILS